MLLHLSHAKYLGVSIAGFFFLISNVNFIKSAEGRNPKKYIYKKTPMKYTKDTYAKILLLLVSHYGNEPLSTHVA
jgi:hypothetical protein